MGSGLSLHLPSPPRVRGGCPLVFIGGAAESSCMGAGVTQPCSETFLGKSSQPNHVGRVSSGGPEMMSLLPMASVKNTETC